MKGVLEVFRGYAHGRLIIEYNKQQGDSTVTLPDFDPEGKSAEELRSGLQVVIDAEPTIPDNVKKAMDFHETVGNEFPAHWMSALPYFLGIRLSKIGKDSKDYKILSGIGIE